MKIVIRCLNPVVSCQFLANPCVGTILKAKFTVRSTLPPHGTTTNEGSGYRFSLFAADDGLVKLDVQRQITSQST